MSRGLLVAAVILALLANVAFFETYPLNIGQWDNPTFLRMITSGNSNLMHASGYPALIFLVGYLVLPPSSLPISESNPINDHWFKSLQILQLTIHLILFLAAIVLCAITFENGVATALALGWGMNAMIMANVNSTAPEWLQGDLIILAFLLLAFARERSEGVRALIYVGTAALFGFAYLVKYNSLVFAISLVPFLLFYKDKWPKKVLQAVLSIAVFAAIPLIFARTYHFTTTRTTQLSFDNGWVMTASVPENYVKDSIERLGIDSLRWAALVRVTPADYSLSGWTGSLAWGAPPLTKKEYAGRLENILGMSREELVNFVKTKPLPDGYSQWGSAVPLNYYYGLEKMNALGVRVYKESLWTHTGYYAGSVLRTLKGVYLNGLRTVPTFPTFSERLGYNFENPDRSAGLRAEMRIGPPPNQIPIGLDYWNPREKLWYYGVYAAQFLRAVTNAPILYLGLNTIAIIGLFRLKTATDRFLGVSAGLGVGAFICASSMLLGLRHKELTGVAPMYFLLLSICVVAALRSIKTPDQSALGEGNVGESSSGSESQTDRHSLDE